MLFKNDSRTEEVEVALPVFLEGTFALRSARSEATLGARTGEQLRPRIKEAFPPEQAVGILEV